MKGGTEVTKEFGNQSKKIINKKYGPDLINTLTGEKEEGQQQAPPPEKKEE